MVYIRPLCREDALTSYRWRNDPDIWKYTGHRPNIEVTPEIELAWIERVLADGSSQRFAICISENNRYIGNVQVTGIDNGSADFHIFIGDKEYWGRGCATEATKKLIKYAKERLLLDELKLWVNPQNKAAIKVYLKCGFRKLDDQINMLLKLRT